MAYIRKYVVPNTYNNQDREVCVLIARQNLYEHVVECNWNTMRFSKYMIELRLQIHIQCLNQCTDISITLHHLLDIEVHVSEMSQKYIQTSFINTDQI